MQLLYALEQIRVPWLPELLSYLTYFGGLYGFMVLSIIMFWCIDKRWGLYLGINSDGGIFAEADEDDENVGFYASAFGQYPEKRRSVWRTEAEERELAEKARKEKRKSRAESIVLAILTVGAAVLFVYKIYCLFER